MAAPIHKYYLNNILEYLLPNSKQNVPVLCKNQSVTDVYFDDVKELTYKYIMLRQLCYYMFQWVSQVTITFLCTV